MPDPAFARILSGLTPPPEPGIAPPPAPLTLDDIRAWLAALVSASVAPEPTVHPGLRGGIMVTTPIGMRTMEMESGSSRPGSRPQPKPKPAMESYENWGYL